MEGSSMIYLIKIFDKKTNWAKNDSSHLEV
jgi:hypothetical protein